MTNIKRGNKMLNNHSIGVSVATTKNKVYFLLLLTLIFVYAPQFAWGQKVLKTHTGQATDDSNVLGTIKYTYYEQDYERIKEGNFSFASNENGMVYKLTGKFKDGLRDGIWTSSLSVIELGKILGSFNIVCYYSNGIPDGNWKLNVTQMGKQMSEIVMVLKKGQITSFNANNPTGFKCGEDKVKKVILKFDANDLLAEDYLQYLNGQEELCKYSNGILALEVIRNTLGETKSKKEFITDLSSLDKNYIETKKLQFVYDNIILPHLFLREFRVKSVLGGVKEDIKYPEYILTLTKQELETLKKQENQKKEGEKKE